MSRFVIQTSFIGDCVLSLPFLKTLLELDPTSDVHVVAQPAGARLFEIARNRGLHDYKSRLVIHEFHKKEFHLKTPWGLAQWIKKNVLHGSRDQIRTAFCLQRSFRSAAMAIMGGAKERVGFASGGATFLYTHVAPRAWNSGQSEIEKNLDLLRVYFDSKKIEPWVFNPAAKSLLQTSEGLKKVARRIVVSIGSPWPTKDWPLENLIEYIQLAMSHECEVVLTGDHSAIARAQEIEKRVASFHFKNQVGQTTVEEWVDLIGSAELLVSGDSAAVHVASDLNVPVLALFGPTVPDFGFAPWRRPSLVLGVNDLKCRPCDIHGPKICPLGHHKCMTDIKPQKVWGFSSDFIEKRR